MRYNCVNIARQVDYQLGDLVSVGKIRGPGDANVICPCSIDP